MEIKLDETQIAVVEFAISRRVSIITGGAGTGKTTIIKEITERLKALGEAPELCAFAGKAAARLKEATGIEACTIHRMLGYCETHFSRGDLKGVSVIVDEASMVSSDLLAEIVKRKPGRLVLVGDPAQLPPVGKGQPFHDLIKASPEMVGSLTKCYRNKEAVFKAATAIRNGEMPPVTDESESERWDMIAAGSDTIAQRQLMEYIQAGNIDFATDIILCPRNGDNDEQACTVKGLNKAIVDLVNPRSSDDVKWMIGDRVINTKNYSDKDVWNGTTGEIHSIDHSGDVWVKLDTPIIDWDATSDPGNPIYKEIVLFDKDMRKTLQLAYALTVHKAQGSQYRKVVIVALERDSHRLLDRALLYTAVTRTREHCIVLGQMRAVSRAINTVREKRTVLQELARISQ